MNTTLGTELIGASFAVRGSISTQEAIRTLRRVVRLIKMQPHGDPIVRVWPGEGGVGGTGVTVFQSLVESFAVIETWEDLEGFYLVIHSCRPFDPYDIWWFLDVVNEGKANPWKVVDTGGSHVRLTKPKGLFRRLLEKWG